MNKVDFYAEQAVPVGTCRYYSTLFAKPEEKKIIHRLYALEDALQQPLQCIEPMVALNKWHWWREEINRLFKQQAQHPITQALESLPQWHSVQEDSLIKAIDCVRNVVKNPYCRSETNFYGYCNEYHSAMALVFFQYGGWHETAALHCAQALGKVLGIGKSLVTLRQQILANRCPLPLQTCPDEKALLQGNMTKNLIDWLHQWIAKAEEHFYTLKEILHNHPQQSALWRPPFLLALLHITWLRKMDKAQYPIFQRDIQLTPLQQLWTVCRHRQ